MRALQHFVLRTRDTPLRAIWGLSQRACARLALACLTWGERGVSAYSSGRLISADFTPGLSDVDLVIVLKDGSESRDVAPDRVRRRWQRLRRLFPMIDMPRIYNAADLRELVGSSMPMYGLDARNHAAAGSNNLGESESIDRLRLLVRPGLYTSIADWHRLTGKERLPEEPTRDPQQNRIAAWLELVFWWRTLFRACVEANEPRPADTCIKCIAETVRIWVWLAHGERIDGRVQALRRGLELLPEEENGLRRTLELRRSLPRATLVESLWLLVRLSNRVAALIDADGHASGFTQVRVAGDTRRELILAGGRWKPSVVLDGGCPPAILPLADWPSITGPLAPDDSFALLTAEPSDPSVLLAAAQVRDGPYPTLLGDRVLIRPGTPFLRTRLRGIQCRTTDPVSFALIEGAPTASFPNLRGWSAADVARRGVAEHRAWLRARTGSPVAAERGRELGMLLSAARAALFLQSIADGRPELPLTLADGVRALVERSATAGPIAEEALGEYRAFAHNAAHPRIATLTAMGKFVLGLEPYATEQT
jgi:hypothetical protein